MSKAVRELLAETKQEIISKGWCQGNKFGETRVCTFVALVDVAERHCATGHWFTPGFPEARALLLDVLGVPTLAAGIRWNDAPGRTAEQVFALLDMAIARAG